MMGEIFDLLNFGTVNLINAGTVFIVGLPLISAIMAMFLLPRFLKTYTIINAIGSAIGTILAGIIALYIDRNVTTVSIYNLLFLGGRPSYVFAMVSNIIYFFTTIYCYDYIRNNFKEGIKTFYFFLSFTMLASFAIAFANDLVTTLMFYQMLILAKYVLITNKHDRIAWKVGEDYLFTAFGTTMFFLVPATILIYVNVGHVNFLEGGVLAELDNDFLAAAILALFVFGVSKNAVAPFYGWLIESHVASMPVNIILHSVAVKIGSIFFIKVIMYIFGMSYCAHLMSSIWTGGWIFYWCGGTAVYTAYKAMKTNKIDLRLIYSTVGQLSYIIMGVCMATSASIMGAEMHLMSHSLAKALMLMIVGSVASIYGIKTTQQAALIAPHLKWLFGMLVFCGMSITGLPILLGFYGKYYIIMESLKMPQYYPIFIFLVIGSIINFMYIWPLFKATFLQKKIDNTIVIKKIPTSMTIAMTSMLIIIIFLMLSAKQILHFVY